MDEEDLLIITTFCRLFYGDMMDDPTMVTEKHDERYGDRTGGANVLATIDY